MAWHKLATITPDEYIDAYLTFKNATQTEEAIEYELRLSSDDSPVGGSSVTSYFEDGVNHINDPTGLTLDGGSVEIWINDDGQDYAEIKFTRGIDTFITDIDLATPCLANCTAFYLSDIGLETLIGLQSLTALSTLNIANNSMTSEQVNAIVLDLFEYAINTLKKDGSVDIILAGVSGVNEPPTGDGLLALEALQGKGWTVDGQAGSTITNIKNVYDLQAMLLDKEKIYSFGNEIDAYETKNWNGGAGFKPIGNSSDFFRGELYGNGKVIKGLYINRPTESDVGLIGANAFFSVLEGIGITDCEIKGENEVGALIGSYLSNTGHLSGCFATGKVTGTDRVGGLIGYCIPGNVAAEVTDSFADCRVKGTNAGGFAGRGGGSARFKRCHSAGFVDSKSAYSGGFIGRVAGTTAQENCYYNKETSGKRTDQIATGLTAAEFKDKANFANWDFKKVWAMGKLYPLLRMFLPDDGIIGEFNSFRNRFDNLIINKDIRLKFNDFRFKRVI